MTLHLFDHTSADRIPWPETDDGLYAKRYLLPMLENGTSHYIRNVNTKLYVMLMDQLVIPITVNDTEYNNSYVCSPYTHYISYAREELRMLNSRTLKLILSYILYALGWLLKISKVNKTVNVNNWLVSTNLYVDLTDKQLTTIVLFLKNRFPDHHIVFRSLNRTLNGPIIESLQQLGSKLIPSRQIYMLHPSMAERTNSKARWLVKRDFQLLDKFGYHIIEGNQISESSIPRILHLYKALYLDKYSYYNPQFTEAFIRMALRDRSLHIYALVKEGSIDAVLGFFCRNGSMTTPLFGYDTSISQDQGLYRMLSAVLIRIAESNGHLLHESSGAAKFKRNRGAISDIEYSAVIDQHLPIRRRTCWTILGALLNGIGVPIMKKKKL